MKALKIALLMLGVLGVLVSTATGQQSAEPPHDRSWFEVFREDWENGGVGWTLEDRSGRPSDFHVSEYYAYDDGTAPNYSYWCGSFDYDADGGYGDGWNGILELPDIDLTDAINPRLSFRYRRYSYAYPNEDDLTRVQVKHLGEYRDLALYSGASSVWHQQPPLDVQPFDNPLEVRFYFRSGIETSDETGAYNSVAGAFHVDEIRVYELDGDDYFYDDVEDGVGLCSSVDVPGAGLLPHLIELPCRAFSDPTCVAVTAPGDTTYLPPNVYCCLTSPPIHVEWAVGDQCKMHYAGAHCGAGGDITDERIFQVSVDDGATWIRGAYGTYAMPPQQVCGDLCGPGLAGFDISSVLPAHTLLLRLCVLTDETGIGPGAGGAAGSFVDDVWVECDWTGIQETPSTWGTIKALYRE